MKNIVINVSNLSKGGGAHIAIWLIRKLLSDERINNNLVFIVTPYVYQRLNCDNNPNVYIVDKSPVRSKRSVSYILSIIKKNSIDFVFTLYGPSGINFDCKEISGVANAWITSASINDFFKVHKLLAPLEILKYLFLGLHLRKKESLIFETKTSRDDFCKRFLFNKDNTQVIPNTVNDIFYNFPDATKPIKDIFNILYVSAYYKHKNFEMIPEYAYALKQDGTIKNFKFQLTLSESDFAIIKPKIDKFGCGDLIENLGVVDSELLPRLYNEASIVISPSVVETFSATYAEAIVSKKYLAVADKLFAKEICKNSALYFDPYCVNSFTKIIEKIYFKENLQELDKAISLGSSLFISSSERYNLFYELLAKN